MYKPKTKRKKKEKAYHRIRTRHHRLHATSPYHYTTKNDYEFYTRITNVFIQRFSSYFKAVGPNRFHFLCKILRPSKCIAKSTFFTCFLKRGHNFNRTKIVGFLCKFTDLPTCRLTHNSMI